MAGDPTRGGQRAERGGVGADRGAQRVEVARRVEARGAMLGDIRIARCERIEQSRMASRPGAVIGWIERGQPEHREPVGPGLERGSGHRLHAFALGIETAARRDHLRDARRSGFDPGQSGGIVEPGIGDMVGGPHRRFERRPQRPRCTRSVAAGVANDRRLERLTQQRIAGLAGRVEGIAAEDRRAHREIVAFATQAIEVAIQRGPARCERSASGIALPHRRFDAFELTGRGQHEASDGLGITTTERGGEPGHAGGVGLEPCLEGGDAGLQIADRGGGLERGGERLQRDRGSRVIGGGTQRVELAHGLGERRGGIVAALLEAATLVWRRFPDARFAFIGPPVGDSEAAYRGADPRILRLGAVDLQTKTDALAACTVLCVPSTQESFGGVYAEAWSFGKPVIGARIPAVAEVIDDGGDGLLTEQRPAEIADRLLQILGDASAAERMGAAGLRKVAEKYSWNVIAQRTRDAYRRVMGV